MILERLQKTYPYKGNFKDSLSTFIFISVFITVFVYIFRINEVFPDISNSKKILFSFYYGIATFCAASFNTLILKFIVTQKTENNWKVWHEMLLYIMHFFTVSVGLYFLKIAITRELGLYSHIDLLKSFSTTIITGIIPVSIHILIEQNKLYKKYYKQAEKLESDRQLRKTKEPEETIFLGEQTIPVSNILYLESNRNYITINIADTEPLTIRMTFKEAEELFKDFVDFIRCHRAYIINMNKVEKVTGNAQGLKLTLSNTSTVIPVSRTYINDVKQLLSS